MTSRKLLLRVGNKVLVKTGNKDPKAPTVELVEYSDLGELSDAIMAAGERQRKARAVEEKLRGKGAKDCPCHGERCQEFVGGGRLCPVGVCVRMN